MDDATHSAAAPDAALRTPPSGIPVRRRRGRALVVTARRIMRAVWVQLVVAVVLAVLLAPAAAFCAAGIWAGVTYVTSVRALFELVQRFDFTQAFARLNTLEAAARVGLASAAYFAVVSSSMVLAAGVLGRRRRPTFLLVGLLLVIPSALLFSLGASLIAGIVGSRFGLAAPAFLGLFLYALLDGVLVGALLVDMRPRRARAQRRRVRRERGAEAPVARPTSTHTTPMVRFGPTQPLDAPPAQDAPIELNDSTTPQIPLASQPSILKGAIDQPAKNAGEPKDAEAQPLAGIGAPATPGT